jgi:predicted nucleotidyltransferase
VNKSTSSPFVVTAELRELAKKIADWAAAAPGSVVYVYGSRVRGDHKPTSDVDICMDFPNPKTQDTRWWTDNNQDEFKQISAQLASLRCRARCDGLSTTFRGSLTGAPQSTG